MSLADRAGHLPQGRRQELKQLQERKGIQMVKKDGKKKHNGRETVPSD